MLFRDRAIIRLETTDSTNNYAANLIRLSGPPEGTVITAQYQTSGKGQRESVWESNEGDNLLCSIILYPRFLTSENQFYLSQCIALAIHDILETRLNCDVFIKWPNDIIVNGKKIAGILVEATWSENQMTSVVIGVGININQQSFDTPTAISVRQITNKFWDTEECLHALIDSFDRYYLKLMSGNFAEIQKLYRLNLYKLGQLAEYRYKEVLIHAMITGVDQYGRLKLHTSNGETLTCNMKEISMPLR